MIMVVALCFGGIALAVQSPPPLVQIISTTPEADATGVSTSISDIIIQFNVDVLQPPAPYPDMIKEIILKEVVSGEGVEISCSVSGDSLMIQPQAALKENTEYQVKLPFGAVGYELMPGSGVWNMLNPPCQFNFTTGAELEIISVNPDPVNLKIGDLEEQQLVVTTDPGGATIGFQSGDNTVATVSASGLVEAVGVGNTTITVTASKAGYTDPAPVIIPVNVAAGDLELIVDPDSVDLEIGELEEQQLVASSNPLGADIGFQSADNAIATVSPSGLVEAVGVGNTTITVTASKAGYTDATPVIIPVTVEAGELELIVDPDSIDLEIDGLEEQQLVATSNPLGAAIGFQSGDNAVATVDASGLVQAVGVGTTTITVTASMPGYNDATPVLVPVTVEQESSSLRGDVNNDGTVNVLDVVTAINIALGKLIATPEQLAAADMNGDGIVNVLDVVSMINLALGR